MTYTQLIRRFGSQAEAARKLRIPQTTISAWRRTGIPTWRKSQIAASMNGKRK